MNLPSKFEDLLPYLASFGVAIGTGKLLASSQRLTIRAVVGRATESAMLCMCAGVGLLIWPAAAPIAVLGIGGLIASVGVSGALAAIRAWKGTK